MAHATDHEESSRYALQGTLVTPDGYAVATDGRIAACVKVKIDKLDSPTMVPQDLGPLSKSDLKADYHANGELRCEKHSTVKGQQRIEQADVREGRFPRVGDILNGVDASTHLVLAINAEFLWRLSQAINVPDTGDVVVLLIPAPDKDGVVTQVVGVLSNHESCPDAGGFGVIMPCDAEAKQARADFDKLRKAAATSLDAAAKAWSERSVTGAPKEEATEAVDATESPTEQPAPSKPRRKRSVA
jgi:hypothetical protein